MADFTLIIPTLNEEANIGVLIRRLHELYPGVFIIVADDGSTDRTIAVAKKHGAVVVDRHAALVKGITAAVVDAMALVTTPFVIVMDADFQHPPEKVAEIREQLDDHDVVIAARTRVLGEWGIFRRLQSWIATALAVVRLRRRVKDPLSGFFGMRMNVFGSLTTRHFEMRCFKILFNILKSIHLRAIRIGYVFYD